MFLLAKGLRSMNRIDIDNETAAACTAAVRPLPARLSPAVAAAGVAPCVQVADRRQHQREALHSYHLFRKEAGRHKA